jgi:hypothetical protein
MAGGCNARTASQRPLNEVLKLFGMSCNKNHSPQNHNQLTGNQFYNSDCPSHSDYKTVSPYWVLPVYIELIRAVWADVKGK